MKENIEIKVSYIEDNNPISYIRLYPSLDEFIADHQEIFDCCYGAGCWTVE